MIKDILKIKMSQEGSKLVRKVLEVDRASRVKGIEDDLYTLKDIEVKEWDRSLPTIVKSTNVFHKKKIITNPITFRKTFYKKLPLFDRINFNNILIAGGCISSILTNNYVRDIDIFIYGLTEEEANEKIKQVCKQLVTTKKIHMVEKQTRKSGVKPLYITDITDEDLDLLYIRSKNTFTMNGPDYKYQFIFRIYKSISEILHGFDLGSSAVGFDGENVYFTTLSKFSYEHMCNIIDTTRRSTTYESRLRKYFDRGFNIIMPDFNIDMVDNRTLIKYGLSQVCELPHLVFTYNGYSNNQFVQNMWHYDYYGPGSDYDIDEDSEYVLFYHNIKCLIRGKYGSIVYMGNDMNKVYDENECFTRARITYFYNQLCDKINSDGSIFPTRAVENYMMRHVDDVFLSRKDKKTIRDTIDQEIKILCKKMDEIKGIKIKWITENPGTQLTSSYNPIIEDPEKWYGKYYKK